MHGLWLLRTIVLRLCCKLMIGCYVWVHLLEDFKLCKMILNAIRSPQWLYRFAGLNPSSFSLKESRVFLWYVYTIIHLLFMWVWIYPLRFLAIILNGASVSSRSLRKMTNSAFRTHCQLIEVWAIFCYESLRHYKLKHSLLSELNSNVMLVDDPMYMPVFLICNVRTFINS